MSSLAREDRYWLVQPLLDAGLDLEEICGLVFRLGFDGVVGGRDLVPSLTGPVSDRPPEVQAAWARMIGRMLLLDGLPHDRPSDDRPCGAQDAG